MLDIFTIVWGQLADVFLELTLPSLMQLDNIPAAKKFIHCYNFYTTEEAKKKFEADESFNRFTKEVEVNWLPLQKGEWDVTSNILYQMDLSAKEKHHMMVITPDLALGNGSILNMVKLVNKKYNPILYVGPRVYEEGYEIIKDLLKSGEVVSNRKLVSIAMEYIHIDYPLEFIECDKWLVSHNVPTPCLLPDEKIIKIFATNPTKYGGYDHILPYWMIELGYPWYLIKDSDIFFFVERGRHFVHETSLPWDERKQITALEFFGKQEEIWHSN